MESSTRLTVSGTSRHHRSCRDVLHSRRRGIVCSMRISSVLLVIALALASCSEDGGSEPDDTPSASDESMTDDELLFYLLDTTGCGTPLEQQEYASEGVDYYTCNFTRGLIYLTATANAMDEFIESSFCQRELTRVRGDRWLFATGDDSLTDRLLSEGAERVDCGKVPQATVCETPTPATVGAERAQREAKAAVALYLRTLGDVMRNPRLPMETLSNAAVGNLLKGDIQVYGGTRDYGTREGGKRATLRDPRVIRADLSNADEAVAGGCPYVVVGGCRDTSETKELHIDGKDAAIPFTPARFHLRFTVVLTEDGWRVIDRGELRPYKGCRNRFLLEP